MRKIILAVFVCIPLLSFGQLSQEEKGIINDYSDNLCDCINNVLESNLDAKALSFVLLMAEEGEEVAKLAITEYVQSASKEKTQELVASFDRMSTEDFQKNIAACDEKNEMDDSLKESLDKGSGVPYDYFFMYLNSTSKCKLTGYLMQLAHLSESKEKK